MEETIGRKEKVGLCLLGSRYSLGHVDVDTVEDSQGSLEMYFLDFQALTSSLFMVWAVTFFSLGRSEYVEVSLSISVPAFK